MQTLLDKTLLFQRVTVQLAARNFYAKKITTPTVTAVGRSRQTAFSDGFYQKLRSRRAHLGKQYPGPKAKSAVAKGTAGQNSRDVERENRSR